MIKNYSRTDGKPILCPSILSADFAALGEAIEKVEDHVDVIHLDIMDGHFVPNMTIGPMVIADLRRRSQLVFDVHLMIENPLDWIEHFANSGADMISIHQEACPHLLRGLQQIRDLGLKAGVVINPGTPLAAIEEALPYADFVLLMTVNPGFGGQQYIDTMTDKISRLRQVVDQLDNDVLIQIDGGVNPDNIARLYQAGADLIVVGNAVFGQPDPVQAVETLKACFVS